MARGFGIVVGSNTSDAFNPDVTGLTLAQLAVLPVMQCPIGYYGPGNDTGAKCQRCDASTLTAGPGTGSAAECVVCAAGHGKPAGSQRCELCPLGTWQPGTLQECQPCETSSWYAPVDGAGATLVSAATTLMRGATRLDDCVAQQSQLAPEAGQAFVAASNTVMASLMTTTTQPNLSACLAACPAGSCCMAQWDSATARCQTATLAPAAADAMGGGLQLLYKLPASGQAIAALSAGRRGNRTRAAGLALGWWASCDVPAAQASAWTTVGSALTPDARAFSPVTTWDTAAAGRAACKATCEDSNLCTMLLFDTSAGACSYRGGVDALGSRAFFSLPTGADLAALKWTKGNV